MRPIAHFPIRICAEASQIPRIQIPLRDLYSCADAELEIRRAFLSVETLRKGGNNASYRRKTQRPFRQDSP